MKLLLTSCGAGHEQFRNPVGNRVGKPQTDNIDTSSGCDGS